MKVKRTCRNCGTVWQARIGIGGLFHPGNLLRILFRSLLVGFTRGSVIDMQYMEAQDEKREKTCPSCNYTIYSQEKVVKQKTYAQAISAVEEIKKPIEAQEETKKLEPKGKQATTPVAKGCAIIIIVAFVIIIIITSIIDKREINAKENASFERAGSLLQDSKYEQALNELNSISSNYKKFNEVQILKQKADSLLSEESYELGKKLFDEKNYTEALGVLKKVSANGKPKEYNEARNMVAFIENMENEKNYELGSKLLSQGKYEEAAVALKKVNNNYKEYNEAKDMIAFINEYMEAAAVALILATYIQDKNDESVSGKKFQSTLNAANDKLLVLQSRVIAFGIMTEHIKNLENYPKSESKYLTAKEKNNLKTGFKKLTTQARNKLKREQQRDFPLLRKECAKFMRETYRKDSGSKMEIRARGNRNSHLEFINGTFANEANIDYFHKTLLVDTKMIEKAIEFLRFNRVVYKWYEYDNGYYYKYNTPADDVIVNYIP